MKRRPHIDKSAPHPDKSLPHIDKSRSHSDKPRPQLDKSASNTLKPCPQLDKSTSNTLKPCPHLYRFGCVPDRKALLLQKLSNSLLTVGGLSGGGARDDAFFDSGLVGVGVDVVEEAFCQRDAESLKLF